MSVTTQLIKVRVTSSARTERMRILKGDTFEIAVKEPATEGRANARVIELLQERFGKGVTLRLVHGHHSPSKIFSVRVIR